MENPPTPNTELTPASKPFYRRLGFWVAVLIIELIIIFYQHFLGKNNQAATVTMTSVVVASAQTKDIPVYLSALGSVTPTYSVTVRTQVSGQLLRVLFKEGQFVKKGELIAEIDPRPYQAQLMQYEGQLARDEALLQNSKLDLQRYETLWKQNSVAKQTLDTQVSVVKQNEGNVKLDEGLIQTTKVNLSYTQITSPIDGRVGLRLVDPGNFVQPSDQSGLVVINMLNPITVIFTLSEDHIPAVMQKMQTNQPIEIEAYNRNQQTLLDTGTLLTIDNQIDPSTGTVKLKALFKNENNILFPEQFVNVQLLLETLHNAVVVPTSAIQHGNQGTFVFLLSKDQSTVKSQPVKTGTTYHQDTVILEGLTTGQAVVVEGADRLTDGSAVSVANPTPLPPKPAEHASS